VLDCSGSSTPSGECCPRCVCDNIDITNCPSSSVKVSLPASRDEVLYRFMPSTRDCDNQGRHITTKKMPQGDIYRWNGEAGHDITVTASVAGTTTTDTCKFKIIPTGKSSLFVIFTTVEYLIFSWLFSMSMSLKHVSVTRNEKSSFYLIYLLTTEAARDHMMPTAPILLADYVTTGNGLKNGVHCGI